MDMGAMTLRLDGMIVPVLPGSKSRKAKLTIERDGSLWLKAAPDIERAELEQFLGSKRDWIYRKLAEKEAFATEPVTKELVNGEGYLYLGRSHQLRIVNTDDHRVRLQRGRLILPQSLAGSGHHQIIDWYRATGSAWLKPRAKAWSVRLRVDPQSVEIADLGYKWGSALPSGRVRIHWATMQLRPSLVEYVLAHELAHLREPHHGPAFWQLLGRAMPDFDQRKSALAEAGASIWMGIVPPDTM
ncbi:M48 family metallopeptidase [Mycobacteroides abscessus]|uniref:Metal-dependent hydrolase n=1 Tax=Mycobacteroides abscessus TaxID=36809 RepID=A0A0U0ZP38_9MYCO|nr:SprT family zinc-dependent metalloprotease [Mycobacteroides abscessus]SKS17662.1 metal-dependent hydrolase [Mycobacteroides abscessus subsp. abscessus]MBL3733892.1 M48 family metallopeptidase [Mycobacteroides abscessus subsp. massiliense]MBL3745101.1 M48 family metallopeptidase [Mycobacteroides abscessus subsp. massiliense]MBL3760586.1 M48 family metallopeptidase [Mycobacteroides abscessus subsp. massiliense]MBN7481519.1 M48 family metallopeptidase [Mycobacteroides abscessus subsp. massilie